VVGRVELDRLHTLADPVPALQFGEMAPVLVAVDQLTEVGEQAAQLPRPPVQLGPPLSIEVAMVGEPEVRVDGVAIRRAGRPPGGQVVSGALWVHRPSVAYHRRLRPARPGVSWVVGEQPRRFAMFKKIILLVIIGVVIAAVVKMVTEEA
jgi:hypothetical protein